MNRSGSTSLLRWISIILIFIAAILTVLQLIRYSRLRSYYPADMVIAGVPVGNLDSEQAATRLLQVYSNPVEVHYNNAIIQIHPAVVGFQLNLEGMLAAADIQRLGVNFWQGFWDFLWGRSASSTPVPTLASISTDRLRTYLIQEVATRYDRPPTQSIPVPGTVNFNPGTPGTTMDIERAVTLINDAFLSPSNRIVNLTFSQSPPLRPSYQNLQILLQQILQVNNFEGIAEIYLLDLQNNQEINFAYNNGDTPPPGVAFTAGSTIKIPVMVASYSLLSDPLPADILSLMTTMIEQSDNQSTDRIIQTVFDRNLGPLEVTDLVQQLGLVNTFLAGYFSPGSSLLQRFSTPANQRIDLSTSPDIYNQTSPADMGALLDDIYQCSLTGGGTFAAVFPGQITQSECLQMIDLLIKNMTPQLIKAGIPEGTRVAHKHGWLIETDGYIHHMSDAAIVFTPGGNYILTIYLYHPVQLIFDPVNLMVAQLSTAVYNYYNQVNP